LSEFHHSQAKAFIILWQDLSNLPKGARNN